MEDYKKRIIRTFKRKYILALGLLSLFSILSYLFSVYSVRTTHRDGYIINLSGKMRNITQRTTLGALQLAGDSLLSDRRFHLKIFTDRINEMKDIHNFLTHDSVSEISVHRSPEIDSIYFNVPVLLDKKIHWFLDEANRFAQAAEDKQTPDNLHLQYLLNSSNDLLASLNLVVYQYQKDNERKIRDFYYGASVLVICLIFSFLFAGILIFRPMAKEIDRDLTALEEKEVELRKANEKHMAGIIDTQEKERQRIASDLHDSLIQTLTAISHKIEHAKKDIGNPGTLQETKMLIDTAIIETRSIAHSILPPILKQFGLVPALKALSEQIKKQSGVSMTFQAFEFSERLENDLELSLYRIAQEALSNIVKHSGAKHGKIQLIRHPSSIILIIEDDGKGFNPLLKSEKGMGLLNMKERAVMISGNFTVNSTPGTGTELMVEIPVIAGPKSG